MVHDFRLGAEPAFAIVQARIHLLQLRRDGLLNLFWRHSSRGHTFRGRAASREIAEIYDQQRSQAMLQRGARSQRSTLRQALCQSAVGILISEEKVLQYLRRSPLSGRSLRQAAGGGTARCILEFTPQTFEIGIHGVDSVQ